MPSIQIRTSEELSHWLDGKPVEWSQIVGLRSALRVLPLTSMFFVQQLKSPEQAENLAISTFRAATAAWSALCYREISQLDLRRNCTTAARRALRDLSRYKLSSRQGRPLVASSYAALAVGTRVYDLALSSAVSAIEAAASGMGDFAAWAGADKDIRAGAARAAAADLWKTVSSDALALIESSDSHDVARALKAPLWATDPPSSVLSALRNLSRSWRAIDPNAGVWIEWANSRIYGHHSLGLGREQAIDFDLELASQRAGWWAGFPKSINQDVKDWGDVYRSASPSPADNVADFILRFLNDLGRAASISEIVDAFQNSDYAVVPKTVRGELSRLASSGQIIRVDAGKYAVAQSQQPIQIDEVEPQTRGAIQFENIDGEPIQVRHRASTGELQFDAGAQKRHGEVRRRTDSLLSKYTLDSRGANVAKELVDDLQRFSSALGKSIMDLDPDLLIPRGDGLRKDLSAYRNRDDFSALPPVPDDLVLGIEKIVADYNHFVAFDPELARRDEALFGPDAKRVMVPPGSGQAVIEDAVRKKAALQTVVDVLSEDAKVAPAIPDTESRQSRRYSEGAKNFARKAIEVTADYIRLSWRGGKYVITVGGVGYAAAQWMIANQQWLQQYFSQNPIMTRIINDILEILEKLPLS